MPGASTRGYFLLNREAKNTPCILSENLILFRLRDRHALHSGNGIPDILRSALTVVGHVGGKEDVVRPEKIMPAHESRGVAVNGRIPIKHLEIIQNGFPQLARIFGLEKDLRIIIAAVDALTEKGNHGAAVVNHDL